MTRRTRQKRRDTKISTYGKVQGKSLLRRQAKDYASNSSIHGLSYLAESGRPMSERICWMLVTAGGFFMCGLLIAPIFTKWRVSPTYTSINTTNYPVWNIPFPGVTICSNILVHSFHFYYELINSDEWLNVAKEEGMDIDGLFDIVEASVTTLISLQTNKIGDKKVGFDDPKTRDFVNKYHSNLTDMMREVGHSCGYLLLACYWQGEQINCSNVFETSRTDMGFCCSFNTVKLAEEKIIDFKEKDITLSYYDDVDTADGTGREYDPFEWYDGYNVYDGFNESWEWELRKKRSIDEAEMSEEPLRLVRSNSASSALGLTVLLDVDTEYYFLKEQFTMNDYHGFKVLVHSPYDFPEVGSKGFTVGGGQVAYIGVDARRTSSTSNVKAMNIQRRNCLKHDETKEDMEGVGVNMHIFSNYSRPACLIECRAREIFKKCNCLPYYYPQFSNSWKVNTSCNANGIECVFSNPGILRALDTGSNDEELVTGTQLLSSWM